MAGHNRKYPHLLTPDVPVWEAFLAAFGDNYTEIDYDVRVGQGRPAGPGFDPAIQKDALDLSMRRIDAVAHAADTVDIIEITRIADLKAIGQLFTYPLLYAQTYHPATPIRAVLVAERLRTDILTVLESYQIAYYLFEDL